MTRAVVALGGNTLLPRGEGTIEEQRERVAEAVEVLAPLDERGTELVLTHGNGPQVGALLLQQEAVSGPRLPLDVLVAETQAQIGYLLQQEFERRLGGTAATLLTRSVVDSDDPAFDDPSKPVGPYYTRSEATAKPFETREVTTSEGEQAYRRVVPSPRPRAIREADQIEALVSGGTTVVCAGGGGVPVIEREDGLAGVEAVVDKDHASALVAEAIDATDLLFLTDVDCAYVDFGEPDQRALGAVDPATLREHLAAGEFARGSMRPKIEAAVEFVEEGGGRAIITSPERLSAALAGEAGTRVEP